MSMGSQKLKIGSYEVDTDNVKQRATEHFKQKILPIDEVDR